MTMKANILFTINRPSYLETTRIMCAPEDVKAALGGKPVMVNSAFRCKQVNDAVGSKDSSQHRSGCAVDIRVPELTPDEVVKTIIAAGLPYDQLIREFDRWTHISIPSRPNTEPRKQVLIIDKQGTRAYT